MSVVGASVAIVTWNSAPVIRTALSALFASAPLPSEVIVIDNASTDATVATVEAMVVQAPIAVHLNRQVANVGFAAGMNLAIDLVNEPYVLLLNPDVAVTPSMVGALYQAMQASSPMVYAVGPKLRRARGAGLHPTDLIDSTGIEMSRDGRHFDRGSEQIDVGQFDLREEVFGLSGAAVMFRVDALKASKVDGQVFDEDFFAYREDVDLAWRMRGFGYSAIYEPNALGFHVRRVTPKRRRYLSAEVNRHSVKNRFLLRIHHADSLWFVHFGLRAALRDIVVVGACILIERSSFAGLVWLARNFGRHVQRRRQILARRSVSSSSLRRWFR